MRETGQLIVAAVYEILINFSRQFLAVKVTMKCPYLNRIVAVSSVSVIICICDKAMIQCIVAWSRTIQLHNVNVLRVQGLTLPLYIYIYSCDTWPCTRNIEMWVRFMIISKQFSYWPGHECMVAVSIVKIVKLKHWHFKTESGVDLGFF